VMDELKDLFTADQLNILGPIDAPIARMQDSYRYHLILKADSVKVISSALSFLKENLKVGSTIKQVIDIDPYSLM